MNCVFNYLLCLAFWCVCKVVARYTHQYTRIQNFWNYMSILNHTYNLFDGRRGQFLKENENYKHMSSTRSCISINQLFVYGLFSVINNLNHFHVNSINCFRAEKQIMSQIAATKRARNPQMKTLIINIKWQISLNSIKILSLVSMWLIIYIWLYSCLVR